MTGAPVAVITGAASGIGAASARLLRASGWRTAGLDLNDSDTDLPVRLDVADAGRVRAAVDAVADRFGRLDLVVTAAGYYEEGIDVADISRAQWDRMLAVILGGTVNAFQAALPYLLRRGTGGLIAISSELALAGSATDLHYVAAKGAVLGLVKSLALEVAGTGIRSTPSPPVRRTPRCSRRARCGASVATWRPCRCAAW
ncbi:MAG TPA: SDR family oxidoreductase [Trebonia sp.]